MYICTEMNSKNTYIKIIFTAIFLLLLNVGFASFIGKARLSDDRNNFSLKNLGKYKKGYSLSYLKLSQFQFMGSQDLSQQKTNNTVQIQSMLRLERGNTTYVYPYKHTVQIPKFKTPSPAPFH